MGNHVNPNKPIMLWGCSAGAGESSFAQKLSNLLEGRVVVGPTQNTRWSPTRGYVGMRKVGVWRTFGGRQ
jgi:hypothetical protein